MGIKGGIVRLQPPLNYYPALHFLHFFQAVNLYNFTIIVRGELKKNPRISPLKIANPTKIQRACFKESRRSLSYIQDKYLGS